MTKKTKDKARVKVSGPSPWAVHLAAFLLPALGMALVFAACRIYPFGPNSVLELDLNSQYISFLSYLRNSVWLGDGDFLYTFSKALGGDMAGFAAYYLLSPFNFVLLLFSPQMLPVGVSLVMLLKVGGSGLAMSLLLHSKNSSPWSLLFSIPYALMDFAVAFQFNIMWMDTLLLLPLVVLGLEKLLSGKSPLLYVAALGSALAVNYYMGYILCLFSFLYFLVWVFFYDVPDDAKIPLRPTLLAGARFGGASLLAGGLAAVVLAPAFLSLRGGKAGFSLESFLDKSFATPADVVARYLPGTANPAQVFFGYPAIYAGMLALICTAFYFADSRIPRRARLGSGLLVLILLASFTVGPLDRVWHGFNKPVGFLFRYSFLLSFLLLYLGWQGFQKLDAQQIAQRFPVIAGAFVAALLLAQRDTHTFSTPGKLLLGLGIFILFGILLLLYTRKPRKILALLLLMLVLGDMGANAFLSRRRAGYVPLEDFTRFVAYEQPVIDAIQTADPGFYRLEKDFAYSDNDAFLLGYHGLSHFSSSDKMFVRSFLDDLGLSDGGYGVKYADGSTAAVESLLGLKYLVTTGGGTRKPYTQVQQTDQRLVYQNPTALPLGFAAGPDILAGLPQGEQVFGTYNQMWHALDPALQGDLYRLAPFTQQLYHMDASDYEGETLYNKTQEDGSLTYFIQVESRDTLYAHFTTAHERNAHLYINGENTGRFLYNDRHGIVTLGSYEPGTVLQITIVPQAWEWIMQQPVFAYEDGALLQQSTQRLQQVTFSPQSFTSSRLMGDIAATDQTQLLLSIPYEEGWHARLNGEDVPLSPAFGALTALPLSAGPARQLELWFVPPGLYAGLAVSLASGGLLLLWLLLCRKRKSTKKDH